MSSPNYVPFTNEPSASTAQPQQAFTATLSPESVIVRVDPAVDSGSKQYDVDEHMLSIDQLAERYNSSPSFGLSSQHAAELLGKLGPNQLSPPKTDSELIKFLRQFTNPLMVRTAWERTSPGIQSNKP